MVNADGSYSVEVAAPAYHFAGSVGVPVRKVTTLAGNDAVGAYHETDFDYTVGGVDRSSSIRAYDSTQVILFGTTYVQASANANPFPVLAQRPALPSREHFSSCWANPKINLAGDAGMSPYLAFDASGSGYLVSAANNLTTGTVRFDNGALVSGVTPRIDSLPAGFTYKTVLAYGTSINKVYDTWGHALTSWSGKHRPAQNASPTLAKLGYWTDNGAAYYYKFDNALGYQGTLQAVQQDWRRKGLPMGNLQIDSWWYPKGPNKSWQDKQDGQYQLTADPTLFPQGLAAFQKSVGIPLITHTRWIDPASPYVQQYQMSNTVSIDPAYWNDRMAYLKSSGVRTYEQDWLCLKAQPNLNLTDREAFLGNMAAAAKANSMDVQYCMALPQDFLESTKYDAVTNIRTSFDRFGRPRWDEFLYSSRLASAVGLWPFADVMMSTETRNLLMSNLSAGPVGVGDPIGAESVANLTKVAEADGTIVKPDTPIVPNDATYVRDASGTSGAMVATTSSRHGAMNAGYVYAYARPVTPDTVLEAETATVSGAAVAHTGSGFTGTGYVDYQHNTGDYIQWNVNAPTSGKYTLFFRYANGDTVDRPLAVTVDGGAPTTEPFSTTIGWNTWQAKSMMVQLSAGAHTVRLSATGVPGPNIDNLGVSAGDARQNAPFTAADFGISGTAYVYDYFADAGSVVNATTTYTGHVTSDGTYYQVVPIGASGIGFLGDAGKFVSLGQQRIRSLSDDGAVHATVAFAAGDGPVTVHGYSPTAVTAVAAGATVDQVVYHATTHLFSARLTPAAGVSTATLTITR
ncbi:CBM35 domain-containing protein [Amycolatopsis sp. NEAU-NG30]|uniref:CBM35 domain-containing protein n=1 Tax=Amycolatopsis melonis TaxID=3156488 RepID=A0ABV0LJ90_9PSEU